jgi:hypothetical protein
LGLNCTRRRGAAERKFQHEASKRAKENGAPRAQLLLISFMVPLAKFRGSAAPREI